MKKILVALASICAMSGVAVGQVLPSGPAVVKTDNDLVIGRVVELEQDPLMVLRPGSAIITMEVDGENGLAIAYRNNLTHTSYYVASDCSGPPLFDLAILTDSTVNLQFSQTPFFITNGQGQELYRIDPTQPTVPRAGTFAWVPSSQSCVLVGGGTFPFHEGQLVDANFGTEYPGPYRLAVEPESTVPVAASVPAVGTVGLICLMVLLAWYGIQRIRMV